MYSNMDFSPNTFAKPLPVPIGLDDDNLMSPVNLAASQNPYVLNKKLSSNPGKLLCLKEDML